MVATLPTGIPAAIFGPSCGSLSVPAEKPRDPERDSNLWLKAKLGLRQFCVRGLKKAQCEVLWACLTYNLQHWIRLRKLQPARVIT